MSERSQITYMQVRIARMATKKWNISIAEAARVFQRYKVFEYIRDCYGIFHTEGDDAVWDDIIPYLKARGCSYA